MSYIIAITGKGGVGKTSIAALLITALIKNNCKPILAVDADPNLCLDQALGVKAQKTVGGIREEAREIAGKGMALGIAKQELLEMKIAECLVEAENFDLIAMGRPEGPGCYCYANSVLKSVLAEISTHYPYVVLDNEAGLENLSRRIVQAVDLLIMVTDPSQRGLETVNRLFSLALEMQLQYKKLAIIINRLRHPQLPPQSRELQESTHADWLLALPEDPEMADLAENGQHIGSLSPSHRLVTEIDAWVKQIII